MCIADFYIEPQACKRIWRERARNRYIVPDIIVRKEEKWEVVLNDSWIGNYRICDHYLKMMDETQDRELREYFREKAQRVRYIIKNVEQRRETLLNLARLIVDYQNEYLDNKGKLKPMTMAEAAEKMKIHPIDGVPGSEREIYTIS